MTPGIFRVCQSREDITMNNQNIDICAVCRDPIGNTGVVVLDCGHKICLVDYWNIINRDMVNRCPECRAGWNVNGMNRNNTELDRLGQTIMDLREDNEYMEEQHERMTMEKIQQEALVRQLTTLNGYQEAEISRRKTEKLALQKTILKAEEYITNIKKKHKKELIEEDDKMIEMKKKFRDMRRYAREYREDLVKMKPDYNSDESVH